MFDIDILYLINILYLKALSWFLTVWKDILKILGLAITATLVNKILQKSVDKFFLPKVQERVKDPQRIQRIVTLSVIVKTTVRFSIALLLALLILSEVGVNIGPLLAGVGVAGIAVGMGVNTLIADFIAGFFIVLEDRFHVGDTIKVPSAGGVEGEVVEFSLKNTVLQDKEGNIHIIRNSRMDVVTRYKK